MNIKEDFIKNTQKDFIDRLKRILADSFEGVEFFIFCVDVFGFRNINRVYGLEAGDELLRAIDEFMGRHSEILTHTRFYSDHFLYLMRYPAGTLTEKIIAERQLRTAEFLVGQQQKYPACRLNFPCGFSRVSLSTINEAIEEANFARKEAKRTGHGKTLPYDSEYIRAISAQRKMEEELNLALHQESFCFFLQPKVDLRTGEIHGAEALVRRQGENGELISPDKFLPLMESNGSIVELDLLVCRQVCRFLSERIKRGLPVVRTSVNLSRLHTQNPDAAERLHAIAAQYGIPSDLLQFELTETIFLNDFTDAKKLIDKLRLYGYGVAIDDFGSGYAGINIWQELNFDVLKLDKKFLSENPELKRRNEALLPNLINISQRLQTAVLCEGVETEEQCRYLLRLGCTRVQGFYFSKPVPPEKFYETYRILQGKYELRFAEKKKAGEKGEEKGSQASFKRNSRGARFPVHVFAMALCAVFLTVSVLFTFAYQRRSTQGQFAEMTAETLSAYASEQRSNSLSAVRQQIGALKTLAAVIGDNSDETLIEAYLRLLNADSEGTVYQYNTIADLDANLSQRPQDEEIVNALKAGETVVSDIYYSESVGGCYCFAAGVPVFAADGSFEGAIRAVVKASVLTQVSPFPASQGEILGCYLTDLQGNILPTGAQTEGTGCILDAPLSEYAKNKLRELYGRAETAKAADIASVRLQENAASPIYASLASLPYNDWNLLIFITADAASARSQTIISNSIAATAVLLTAMVLVCGIFLFLSKRLQGKLTSEDKRYLLLQQFSDTVLFDYDCIKDTMRFTPNAEKLFKVHALVQTSFLKNIERGYVYAGDMEELKAMLAGRCEQREARVRFTHPDTDAYFWCLVHFLYLYKKGVLTSVVGKIVDIDDLKQREDRLMEMAETDGLTGFLNKAPAEQQIRAQLEKEQAGALFMIDADDFKRINDTYGHILGDKILRGLAERIRDVFGNANVLGRVGGDELVVFAPQTRNETDAREKAEALIQRIAEQTAPDASPISVSIGIALCPRDGASFEELFLAADGAMYRAKREGKHCCRFAKKE